MRLLTLTAALAFALPAAPALAQVKAPRQVASTVTGTCKAWVNWVSATLVWSPSSRGVFTTVER